MFDKTPEGLAERVIAFMRERTDTSVPLGRTGTIEEIDAVLAGSISPEGLGVEAAFDRFERGVVPFSIGLDSERFLAFIPAAPSPTSVWFDAVVSAATFSPEAWMEGGGPIHAENQALAFLSDLAGMPNTAAGCFVSGGSAGNLSALAVARDHGLHDGRVVAVADTVHASVDNTLRILALEAVVVPTGPDGRFTGEALAATLKHHPRRDEVGIVVASAGSTNLGVIDDLDGIGRWCHENGRWFHVDGAYGGAALLVDRLRPAFTGIERADSLIIDPHKWLFSTLDCCALLYREPERARVTHRQHGPYIEVLHTDGAFNPADFAYHLTRRARGLPLWFGLTVHGTDAYRDAVDHAILLAERTAERFATIDGVELVAEPQLSVVVFRKAGWDADRWARWAAELLDRKIAFVAPTTWRGEAVGRLAYLHPRTPFSIIDELAATLA